MAGSRILTLVAATLLCLGVGLRLGIDVLSFVLRQAERTLWSDGPEDLNVTLVVTVLLVAGAVLGLPSQLRQTSAHSPEAGRPLFAGTGAIISLAIIAVAFAAIGVSGGSRFLIMATWLLWGSIGDHVGAIAIILIVAGLASTTYRTCATSGALAVAPLAILAASAFVLESSVTLSAIAVALFMLGAAAGLLPPSIMRQSVALGVWPVSAAIVAIFGGLLYPGIVTPGELAALVAVPVILIGIIGYAGAAKAPRDAWLERAACEAGAVVLGLVALQLVAMAFGVVDPIDATMRNLLRGMPMLAGLALMLVAYVVVALFTSPLAALAICLVAFLGAARIDVPKELLVGELTLATLLAMTIQATFLHPAPAGDRFALPRLLGLVAIGVTLALMIVFAVHGT